MKKRLMIFGLSVVTILLAAVYSIAQVVEHEIESTGVYGKCLGNKDEICEAECPRCHSVYGPIDVSKPRSGEGVLTRGFCLSGCGYNFETKQ